VAIYKLSSQVKPAYGLNDLCQTVSLSQPPMFYSSTSTLPLPAPQLIAALFSRTIGRN